MINAINNGKYLCPKCACITDAIVVVVVVDTRRFCLIEIMKWLNALKVMIKWQNYNCLVCVHVVVAAARRTCANECLFSGIYCLNTIS